MKKGNLESRVGHGKVIQKGGECFYTGNMPYNEDPEGTEVVVMTKTDYDALMRGHLAMIFEQAWEMPIELVKTFPDPIEYTPTGKEPINLWLERVIYTNDRSKSMVLVYRSVNDALEDETF